MMRGDPAVGWPEASVASHLYLGIENSLLTAVISLVSQYKFHHLSLHHDGARVDYAAMRLICLASDNTADADSMPEKVLYDSLTDHLQRDWLQGCVG